MIMACKCYAMVFFITQSMYTNSANSNIWMANLLALAYLHPNYCAAAQSMHAAQSTVATLLLLNNEHTKFVH